MEFKIKQHSGHIVLASLLVLIFILAALFVIPDGKARFFVCAAGACVLLAEFIAEWVIDSFPTTLTVDSGVLKIQYPLGSLKISISDITGLEIERYSITHYEKYKGYSKEHRMRLIIRAGGKTIKLNDGASRKRDKITGTSTVYEELPDSEIALYNAYEMLRNYTG